MAMRLDGCSWPEVAELVQRDPVIVVPVGATEQHGHHLPLQVDATLCTEVADHAARRAREEGTEVVVAPTIAVGYSPHHMDFAGSLTLSASTFTGVVTDVARSLHHHGFRRIVFLNGHGGNTHLLRATVQDLRFERGVDVVSVSYWSLALDAIAAWRRSPLGGINHACEMETSLMMALRPDLVRSEAIHDVMPHGTGDTSADLTVEGAVMRARPFAEITDTGVIGAPSLADAERGRALLAAITERVAGFLQEVARPAVEGRAGG